MATATQTLAHRESAPLSSGPRTLEGTSRSAVNATVLSCESQSDFEQLLANYQSEFNPQGLHEDFLVSQMAAALWRMARMDRLEARAFEQALEAAGAGDPDSALLNQLASPVMTVLARYRSAAEKSYYKAHRELTDSRNRRVRQEATEVRRDAAAMRKQAAEAERAFIELITAPPPGLRNEPNLRPLAGHTPTLARSA